MQKFLAVAGVLGLALGLALNSYAAPDKSDRRSKPDKSSTKSSAHKTGNPKVKQTSRLEQKHTRNPKPIPKSINRGAQGMIGAVSNSGFSGKQPAQCQTDWGYDRCTDILMIGGIDRHDLGPICNLPSVRSSTSLNHYERGMFAITDVTHGASSWSISYAIFCGGGEYFEGATRFSDADMPKNSKKEFGEILFDALTAVFQAMGDAGEPYGVPASTLAEAYEEDLNYKRELEEKAEAWKEAHSEEGTDNKGDEDTDTDDDADNSDADDDASSSLHDDEGCPEGELVLC